MTHPPLTLAIGIATAGRCEQMALTLAQLARQTRRPDRVIVCPAAPADYDPSTSSGLPFDVTVVSGPRGLPAQRNAILAACDGIDALLFLDDDFYPRPDYLHLLERSLVEHPDVVVMTNHPIADGATGPGISHDEALALLARAEGQALSHPGDAEPVGATYGGYGCNLAVRLAPVRAHDVRFDEALPLYGWLEDIDFSRRMAPHGRIVHDRRLIGVHLGTKRGRTSGLRFGYSQIANPVHMVRKGSMTLGYAANHMLRHLAINIVRSLRPEPWVDRRGRMRGNWLALRDALLGRLSPGRILEIE